MTESLQIQPARAFNLTHAPPGSKSLTNRALLLAALADGKSTLTGVLFADDTRCMIEALQQLGFTLEIDEAGQTVAVHGLNGTIPAKDAELNLGNAGTAMRFLTAALCLGSGTYTLDGIPRMRERPIGELIDPLRSMGATIDYLANAGCPPLRVHGCAGDGAKFAGGMCNLEPTLSSQFISAMLMAGPCTERGVTLAFEGAITSLPYIKMSLKLMEYYGGDSAWGGPGGRAVRVTPGGYKARDYLIEPDASNASYFLAAAAVVPGSSCTITDLGSESVQGDAEFCDVLGLMGCEVTQRLTSTTVAAPKNGTLNGIDIRLHRMPDMAQTLAVVALFAQGPTTIRKIGNLRVKETDRLAALDNELTKLGAEVRVKGDTIRIHPPPGNDLNAAAVDTYDDHRMAMSFAVAGLASMPGSEVTINDPACVNKTYPAFWDDLQKLHDAALEPAQ